MKEEIIYEATQDLILSRNESAKIVGGLERLIQLVATDRIRQVKPKTNAQNGRWYLRGCDVLRYAQSRHVKLNTY